jgi:hypothetical protein
MKSLAEIQSAIAQLPAQDVRKLAVWLQSYLEMIQDIELEDDLRMGRTDRIIQRGKAQIESHRHHEH